MLFRSFLLNFSILPVGFQCANHKKKVRRILPKAFLSSSEILFPFRTVSSSNTTDLRNSNQAISDSVQTISAVSEELTAHASETMDAETVNTQILENIAAKMKSLVQYIQKQ